ncbi:helix-turn-helix domain-containing protein [Clostridium sp.]|uniref:helix-turn-helix domain-containing protein n=1 Tax=Clostridium sp. TaxID=1506 RepID=UPI003D6D0BAA
MHYLGEHLKSLRIEKNLKQKDLAYILGLAQTTVANYESGIRFPSEKTLKNIADYFHVSLDELLGRELLNYTLNDTEYLLKLEEAQESFLKDLMENNTHAATELIIELAKGGIQVKDIYRVIFEKSLLMVGSLWENGQMSIAKEHFFSHTIETIMNQLNAFIQKKSSNKNNVLMALPASELHEIPLKMAKDLLDMEGWQTYYLGNNTPIYSIVETLESCSCQLLVMSATMQYNVATIENVIKLIKSKPKLKNVKVIVGGNAFDKSPNLWHEIGSDGFARNLQELVLLAEQL